MWPISNKLNQTVSHHNGNWNDDASKPKRRKIEIACTTCRLRKSRCDGAIPKCGACMKRKNVGPECIYLDSNLESRTSPAPLTARLRSDNTAKNSLTSVPSSEGRQDLRLPQLHSLGVHSTTVSSTFSSPSSNGRTRSTAIDSATDQRYTATPREESPANTSNDNKDSDWILKAGLLAASSSTKFFNTIFGQSHDRQATNDIAVQPEQPLHNNDTHSKTRRPAARRKSIHSADYVLPSRQVADELLAHFFKHVHIQWFDRAELLQWYATLWTGDLEADDPLNEQINYALLNMIFALVYRSEPEVIAEDQEQLAQVHFLRAQKLLQLDLLNFNRMNILYTMFMLLQWYQSLNDVQKCNALVRLCIMVAQNVGLDNPERVSSLPSQRQREMARRAWHGCVLMDRIISMVSGQPLKISQDLAKRTAMFQAIDDEFLSIGNTEREQPVGKPSSHSFYLAFCQLHIILGDILVRTQSDRQEKRVRIDLNHVLEVEESLQSFLAGLPPYLSFQAENLNHEVHGGQIVHLQTRFLHIRILLFRPFFLNAAEAWKRDEPRTTQSFANAVTLQGLLTCIETAKELLNLLGSRIAGINVPRLVPQWWHTVAYVYTAVTVLIAAHMFTNFLEETTIESLSERIQCGFQILDLLSEHKETAKQCKAALTVLYDRHAKHIAETPKRTPHGTVIPPEIHPPFQADSTDLYTDLGWAFADPLDLFQDRDVNHIHFSGDLFTADIGDWL